MKRAVSTAMIALCVLAALVAAGCGASSTGGGNAGAQATPSVTTATATVGGKSETVLTDTRGMTLYYFTSDSDTSVACTKDNGCTATWSPLLAPASGSPASIAALPGLLSFLDGANGKQISYNGHPLYTYGADSAPGDTKGDGVEGKWFVATPELASNMSDISGY
jgi:predicted lipoprotein with Yx(FWY)xxD motif